MPAADERRLARLRARFEDRAREIPSLGFLTRGSILERYKPCSSPGCACHTDPERWHGPYWQWTTKVKGKTVSRTLNEDQVHRYRQWMDNAKHLDQIIAELYEISAEADAILRDLERGGAESGKERPTTTKGRRRERPPSGS
jgi:hypothetical protein